MIVKNKSIKHCYFKLPIFLLSLTLSSCGRYGNPKPPEAFSPPQVQDVSAFGNKDSIDITWTRPLPIEGSAPVSGYVIYRAEIEANSTPVFEEIASFPASNDENPNRKFSDTKVSFGKTYQYSIASTNQSGVESPHKAVAVEFNGDQSKLIPLDPRLSSKQASSLNPFDNSNTSSY